jgi:flavodoxin
MKKEFKQAVRAAVCLMMCIIMLGGMVTGVSAATTIKSVSLKIGNSSVTKKTYQMNIGDKKTLKVSTSPKLSSKTVTYASDKKTVATVSKNGKITAKKAGTAKITVTVKSGSKKKSTWVKIKVLKAADTVTTGNKTLVVYFSCTGSTKTIAEYVAKAADADIYRIEAAVPYTSADLNYNNDSSRTTKEQNDDSARPEISGTLPDLSGYTTVYLGYPIWWGDAPKIMYTFVEQADLSGKTVIPFCTSGSSGIGSSASNLKRVDTHNADWKSGRRFSGSASYSTVQSWVAGN